MIGFQQIFNKIDRTDSETLALAQQTYPGAVFISATARLGLETLRQRLVQFVDAATSNRGDVSVRSKNG